MSANHQETIVENRDHVPLYSGLRLRELRYSSVIYSDYHQEMMLKSFSVNRLNSISGDLDLDQQFFQRNTKLSKAGDFDGSAEKSGSLFHADM
jgi:hypothetical protein